MSLCYGSSQKRSRDQRWTSTTNLPQVTKTPIPPANTVTPRQKEGSSSQLTAVDLQSVSTDLCCSRRCATVPASFKASPDKSSSSIKLCPCPSATVCAWPYCHWATRRAKQSPGTPDSFVSARSMSPATPANTDWLQRIQQNKAWPTSYACLQQKTGL